MVLHLHLPPLPPYSRWSHLVSRALPRCVGTPPPDGAHLRTVWLPDALWARVKARAITLGCSPRTLAHEAAYLGAQDVLAMLWEAQ